MTGYLLKFLLLIWVQNVLALQEVEGGFCEQRPLIGNKTIYFDGKQNEEGFDDDSFKCIDDLYAKPLEIASIPSEDFHINGYDDHDEDCKDWEEECEDWAASGECSENPEYMHEYCRKSCQICLTSLDENDISCADLEDHCVLWASQGECSSNEEYMHLNCPKSCKICKSMDDEEKALCMDHSKECAQWAYDGYCSKTQSFMEATCPKSCKICYTIENRGGDLGVPQRVDFDDGTFAEDILYLIAKARNYMKTIVPWKFREGTKEVCKNEDELCAYWAMHGECTNNEEFMLTECGPMCGSCHALTKEFTCPLTEELLETNIWGPGDLNKMFERLTSEPYKSSYKVDILSSPATDGPWVITMDNVITTEEAYQLIGTGSIEGFQRSTNVGWLQKDGTYSDTYDETRTSYQSWCSVECEEDEIISGVISRLTELTEIPYENSEFLQILRYRKDEKYDVHHDYIVGHETQQSGPRILTFYLYLNEQMEGGGTNFDQLGITVMPKRGRAVLWPSVLDENPDVKDDRTTHQALPVLNGVKYGANARFHLRDFKTPADEGCIS